jgi:hypothetical protein
MAADSSGIGRLSLAWLRAARRYCVMEARVKGCGVVGFAVVDLEAQALDSRHPTPEAARRRADDLVSAAARPAAGGRP